MSCSVKIPQRTFIGPSVGILQKELIREEFGFTADCRIITPNLTNNVDTASRAYNWRGEFYRKGGSRGEQSYQNKVNLKNKN